MTWQPISRRELDSLIADGLARYDDEVRSDWQRIWIEPSKWACSPWGDQGEGFWAVGIKDDYVLWYNDIEDGFAWSQFSERGVIGQYSCGQSEFDSILEGLARTRSQRAWSSVTSTETPAELAGPGRIRARQTTYWQLQARSGATFRVDFKGKLEFFFSDDEYPAAEMLDEHPLLLDFHEPRQDLFIAGTPINAAKLATQVDELVRAATDGWRTLSWYANQSPEEILAAGHGCSCARRRPSVPW